MNECILYKHMKKIEQKLDLERETQVERERKREKERGRERERVEPVVIPRGLLPENDAVLLGEG